MKVDRVVSTEITVPKNTVLTEKISVYDQEILHSNTADQPTASWGKATEH